MAESDGSFATKQRFALLGFYISSLAFALAVGSVELLGHVYRVPLLLTDELRQNVNRRAVEFAFVASLLAAVILALLHSFGMLSVSHYVLPALMVIFWSIGLFFSARRFE